ncbi:uncharacterized protein LOC118742605 isoform X1 [Rhagoletis pomonella]|uniref:uncharacterized protein LOC118742605 isoform X1 n=1 Tax=Rhagoletis pomonella TaxID=28610 RepID=UPI00177B5990|nr:uncharacterized protein LOC118742605 isoform X1 [Rhagoletis pomonella]
MATNEEQREALTAELKAKAICRFCLSQRTDDLTNIYAKDSRVKSLFPLPVEIMAVASIEVFLNDGMPSSVCLKCRLTFDYCYRFKQMCKKAENLLTQVPLLGEWPAPLIKPIIPKELLPKPITPHKEDGPIVQEVYILPSASKEQLSPLKYGANVGGSKAVNVKTYTSMSTPRKILNSNPADLPEPPMPMRFKKENRDEAFCFLTKVENNEEISLDDVQRLIASEELEFTTNDVAFKEITLTTPDTSTVKEQKNKPKVLNKSSIRILNKEADIELEPRLKHPQLKKDNYGNVSIVTEILDPNEPYEPEPDPIKNAAPVQTNVFPCPHCERTFPLLQLRDIHVVNHTRERHFPCTDCNRSFFSKYDLQKHAPIHTGERKYKCTVCYRGFTRPALLHRHEKIHTDIPKFLCVFCEKTFLSKDDMEKHTERHRKNRPFKCKICSKAFAFKQGLERHEVVHSTEQPHHCQYCDKSFCTPSKLARHLVAHAGERPFPCKFCSKSYLLSHHLSRHMRTHNESVVMYSCNECQEQFKTCNELVLHCTVHATITLTCPLCQQCFEDVASVTAHIKEHTNNDAFACEFCDLIYLTYNEKKCHVETAHPSELAAYAEDERKNQREMKKGSDEELDEAMGGFIYDNIPTGNEFPSTINDGEVAADVSQQTVEVPKTEIAEEESHYDVEYLKLEELDNAFDTEILNQMLEDHEPVSKKIKVNDEINVANEVVNKDVTMKRKLPSGNVENIAENTRKSPRNVGANRSSANIGVSTTNQVKVEQKNDNFEGSIASTSKGSKTAHQRKTTIRRGITSTAIVSATPDTDKLIAGTETEHSGDKVVKMKFNEKRMRVQKIVVTKAEAAAMAKQGRLRIKDGNLILTQKSSK